MISNNSLISIIVPIYNVEKYINQCIESIIYQTYTNLEIILVDDGSPDNCPTICDQWAIKDNRIKVIHKTNGGLSDARNAGANIASGEYIAFVDSDDLINIHYIEYLYTAIQETNADISACEFQNFYDEDAICTTINYSNTQNKSCTPKDAISGSMKVFHYSVVWNKLYKTNLLRNEKFRVGKWHEDEFFCYKVYDKSNKLAFVDIPLYYYRQREGSIMNSVSLRHLDALEAYNERLSFLKEKYPDLYIRDKANLCISCFNFYYDILVRNYSQRKEGKQIILQIRNQLRFNLSELKTYSPKTIIYIIASLPTCIDLFCRIKTIYNYFLEM